MIEQYWWNANIENQPDPDGEKGLYEVFAYFQDFVAGIPLNNGYYEDAEATATIRNLRMIGQKDTTNSRVHFWVQNIDHTWHNVVNGIGLSTPFSGSVTIEGFSPGTNMKITWYNFTTKGLPTIEIFTLKVDKSGRLTIQLPNNPDITDIGISIEQMTQ